MHVTPNKYLIFDTKCRWVTFVIVDSRFYSLHASELRGMNRVRSEVKRLNEPAIAY